jgi:excisionase family DNA binding protein
MPRKAAEVKLSDYLTVSEAAELLGVSPSTLRHWDRTDKLKCERHPLNGYRLYHREDLRALLGTLKGPANTDVRREGKKDSAG